ncbi:L,D-transpeptidase [Hyphomicrobium sp.]|uniref:L,D-transpeptidase n=1 Tax=Hyphomicrobium sp. TaxID=82 RepID=UPI002E368E00|nr:L,D-transpeptidase [Hyphomicrobium sp.]HEX2842199.1 L,D-transpeptidase [Hyphomicrobium sp.]
MSVLKAKIGGVLAGVVAATTLVGVSTAASAQSLIEFLWGGEPEYGGQKRQVVSFDSKYSAGQIIVSFGDRRLYHITKAGQAMSYPIAIPREQSRWQGTTTVSSKRENPDWRPTPEMLRENPKLPSWVPGGHPMNPLGVRALYLGSSTYRIHGTDAPWTIGQNVSKGCIRMFNEDVIDLYPKVPTGTKVVVTWERFKTSGGVETADVQSEPAAEPEQPKAKARSVASTPKTGFVVSDEEPSATPVSAEADDEVKVYSRNPDGTYSEESSSVSREPKKQEVVTRYGRKVGGSVSRASQTSVQ